MSLLKRSGMAFDRLNSVLAAVAAVILTVVVVAVSYDVFVRHCFGHSIQGLIELTEYSLVYIPFLGAAWLLKSDEHIKLEMVLDRLGIRARSVLNALTSLLSGGAWLIVAYYGVRVTWEFYVTGRTMASILELPKWPLYVIIPIGSLLFSLACFRKVFEYAAHLKTSSQRSEQETGPRKNQEVAG